MSTRCQICGHEFPIWLGPPLGPKECAAGGDTLCEEAKDRAYGEAARRKACPDAFDADGRIRPGQIARVAREMVKQGLNPLSGRPASNATPARKVGSNA